MRQVFNMKVCECGCGEMFEPTKDFQKFVNEGHRQDYHRNEVKRMKRVMEALGPDGVARVLSGTYE